MSIQCEMQTITILHRPVVKWYFKWLFTGGGGGEELLPMNFLSVIFRKVYSSSMNSHRKQYDMWRFKNTEYKIKFTISSWIGKKIFFIFYVVLPCWSLLCERLRLKMAFSWSSISNGRATLKYKWFNATVSKDFVLFYIKTM